MVNISPLRSEKWNNNQYISSKHLDFSTVVSLKVLLMPVHKCRLVIYVELCQPGCLGAAFRWEDLYSVVLND